MSENAHVDPVTAHEVSNLRSMVKDLMEAAELQAESVREAKKEAREATHATLRVENLARELEREHPDIARKIFDALDGHA